MSGYDRFGCPPLPRSPSSIEAILPPHMQPFFHQNTHDVPPYIINEMRSLVAEIQRKESALERARHPAEADAIERSLDRLVDRYESLRAGSAVEGDERMARQENEAEAEYWRENDNRASRGG